MTLGRVSASELRRICSAAESSMNPPTTPPWTVLMIGLPVLDSSGSMRKRNRNATSLVEKCEDRSAKHHPAPRVANDALGVRQFEDDHVSGCRYETHPECLRVRHDRKEFPGCPKGRFVCFAQNLSDMPGLNGPRPAVFTSPSSEYSSF